jgi:hypothetical protein
MAQGIIQPPLGVFWRVRVDQDAFDQKLLVSQGRTVQFLKMSIGGNHEQHAQPKNDSAGHRGKKNGQPTGERKTAQHLLPLGGFQHVAHATHRLDQFDILSFIDFDAQAAHGDLDHIGVAVKIHIPYLRSDQ